MKYIVCKQFKRKGLGGEFNLRKGSSCEEINGVITHNEEAICIKSSQNAYDYFARNDDKNGYERFNLTHEILDIIKDYVLEFNEAYMVAMESGDQAAIEALDNKSERSYEIIRLNYPQFLRGDLDVFSFEFYNAEIEDLEHVKELVYAC